MFWFNDNGKFTNEYVFKQHKRDSHKDLSVSVTPPPKKSKENEYNMDEDIENIVRQIDNMMVDTEKKNEEEELYVIDQNDKIPEKYTTLFTQKGLNIQEYKIRRVGGGGKCGANCVSLHTTGTEQLATDIRINANRRAHHRKLGYNI